ncbi:MAG TPA: glucokinase [Vicinamibacterales bacterium]|jgi:glucokinase|nr:glucokinase [Vicinamibacterales bacterium]
MKENEPEVNMLVAGDIGGTKTLLGLYERVPGGRPKKIASREFTTLEHAGLPSMLGTFLGDQPPARIDAASFGVAGPVLGRTAQLTNVPWRVNADEIAEALRVGRVGLLNDLEAMAYGVTVLAGDELHVLQEGEPAAAGNAAVIAAGTGLGEALLHNVDGRLIPAATEAGHADFAARTDRDIRLLLDLTARFGRAENEHVICGLGLVNVHRAAHTSACLAGIHEDDPDAPAKISAAALEGRCAACVETLDQFVEAYGAEAGNLALRTVATRGIFVGGGIAPKILPALTSGLFIRAFLAKGPFSGMLRKVPVSVVLNQEAGLLGAAVFVAVS